jgi:hypothetical protein
MSRKSLRESDNLEHFDCVLEFKTLKEGKNSPRGGDAGS